LSWATKERPGSRQISNLAFRVAAQLFVQQDPGTAFERIKQATSQNPYAVNDVLNALARRGAGSEENRREFFDLTKNIREESDVLKEAFRRGSAELATNWAENDPAGALNNAEPYGMQGYQLDDFRKTILRSVVMKDPAMVLNWIPSQSEGTVDINTRSFAYSKVAAADPAQAIAWAVQYDQFDLLSETLERQTPWALGYHDSGPDSQKHLDGLRSQLQAWQQHQPEAAGAWLDRIPANFRETLTAPANATTH
jgi:hypothetical protein